SFFCTHPPTPDIYTLSLHDALPILGKVGHFRKAGIGIPKEMEQQDLALISDLIHEYKPLKIIFLGDLFHSDMNNDWDWLVMWRSDRKSTRLNSSHVKISYAVFCLKK